MRHKGATIDRLCVYFSNLYLYYNLPIVISECLATHSFVENQKGEFNVYMYAQNLPATFTCKSTYTVKC